MKRTKESASQLEMYHAFLPYVSGYDTVFKSETLSKGSLHGTEQQTATAVDN